MERAIPHESLRCKIHLQRRSKVTYQRDPDPVERTRPRLRRDDDSWGMLPILLGLVFLVMIGFFARVASHSRRMACCGMISVLDSG